MNIVNGIISKENLKEDLIIFGQFDCDANGDNGEEYLEPEAKEAGFETNLEYWADLAQKELDKTGDLEQAIETFVEELEVSWHYYSEFVDHAITTDITPDGYLLTFVFSEN